MTHQRVALLLLPLAAGAAATGEGLRGSLAEAQATEAPLEQGACGKLPTVVAGYGRACFEACPEVCDPLAAAADAWLAKHNPAYAVCGAQEHFDCLFNNPEPCAKLLEEGDKLTGEALPRSKAALAEACEPAKPESHGEEPQAEAGAVEAEPAAAEGGVEEAAEEAAQEPGAVEAESLAQSGGGFCSARSAGFFCMGRTRVQCCRRKFGWGWGMTTCKSWSNWHGCWR